jgi:hypothetical protein
LANALTYLTIGISTTKTTAVVDEEEPRIHTPNRGAEVMKLSIIAGAVVSCLMIGTAYADDAKIFKEKDLNKDGKLTFAEYKGKNFSDIGEERKRNVAANKFWRMDRNKDLYLQPDEFNSTMKHKKGQVFPDGYNPDVEEKKK